MLGIGKRVTALRIVGAVALLAACGDDGGGTGGSGEGAGATTTGTTKTSTTQTGSSQSTGQMTTTTGGEGGGDCDAVIASLSAAIIDAKACNPLLDIEQCTQILQGPCCPIAVNPSNAAAVAAIQDGMQDLQNGHCTFLCPDIQCIENPAGGCVGDTEMGSCTELPTPQG